MTGRLARLVVCLLLTTAFVPAAPVAADGPGFHLDQIPSSFKRPTYVTANGNPLRLFVVEQRGVIKVLKRPSTDQPWQNGGVYLDIRARVLGPLVGRGLLGLAFDPNFATSASSTSSTRASRTVS